MLNEVLQFPRKMKTGMNRVAHPKESDHDR
jgi:hypothetical protein